MKKVTSLKAADDRIIVEVISNDALKDSTLINVTPLSNQAFIRSVGANVCKDYQEGQRVWLATARMLPERLLEGFWASVKSEDILAILEEAQ